MVRTFRPRRSQFANRNSKQTARKALEQQGGIWMWMKCRKQYLSEHPLCERCLAKDVIKPAQEVHHIKKARHYPHLILDHNNLEALCKPCHWEEHQG